MAEHATAVLGGGGIAEQDNAVLGGGGIAEQVTAVLGGGGMAEQITAVLGGGGITGPGRGTSAGSSPGTIQSQLAALGPTSIFPWCV
jgi:hypothetical protein